tara:strand:+ start:59464 stop:60312 length:849 start_codon:yes stop_codon:yes gene_type:complete
MKIYRIAQEVDSTEYEVPWKNINKWYPQNVGEPISNGASEGLCQRTMYAIKKILLEKNLPVSTNPYTTIVALSPGAYLMPDFQIDHWVALTEIDGKRVIVDEPQIEFLTPTSMIENSPYEGEEWVTYTHPELGNKIQDIFKIYEISTRDLFLGNESVALYVDVGQYAFDPFFDNVRTEDGYIYGEWNGVEARISENDTYGGIEYRKSSLPIKDMIAYNKENFTPRLIPITKEAIMQNYGVDEKTAKANVEKLMTYELIIPGSTRYEEYKNQMGLKLTKKDFD